MKLQVLQVFAVLSLAAGTALAGTVVTFDDLNTRDTFDALGISNTYQGFLWSSSGGFGEGWASATVAAPAVSPAPTPVSGQSYAWNWDGVQSLYITFPSPSSVNGADFATLSSSFGANASSIQMFGYDAANNLKASSSVLDLTNTFQFLSAGFTGVTKLEIRADSSGQWFSVDNIDLSSSGSAAPEPSSIGLVALAALGLGSRLKKKLSA